MEFAFQQNHCSLGKGTSRITVFMGQKTTMLRAIATKQLLEGLKGPVSLRISSRKWIYKEVVSVAI
jgi:hypothetical protein